MAGRCTLCGGKLDSQNICTECGLNNNKSDKNYKINESSCDRQPLTHSHREDKKKKESRGKQENKDNKDKKDKKESWSAPGKPAAGSPPRQAGARTAQRQKQHKKNAAPQIIATLSVLVVFFGMVQPFIEDQFFQTEYEDIDEEYVEYPYESVEREISKEGSEEEYLLHRGDYVVGIHIPEGNYTAEGDDPLGMIQVEDPANGIYLYESMEESENGYLDDLWLYKGAHVIVETESAVRFSTENAQLSDMYGVENPLTETVQITGDKTLEAGKDFAPGIYDLEVKEGSGTLEVVFCREEGDAYEESVVREIYFSEGEYTEYKNLVLAPGIKLMFEEAQSVSLKLAPSGKIENEEYGTYYSEMMYE